MRYLILSDVHSNWEALRAVLRHASGAYDETLCCGDLIGYGADPNLVVDWAREHCAAVVRGNHDRASVGLDDLEWFNPIAKTAALWTQRELTPENTAYVRNLPKGPLLIDGFQLLHGSPLDEDEYMLTPSEASQVFAYLETPLAFFGHTHLQGGFRWCGENVDALPKPGREASIDLPLEPDCAYLLNPGSVGQPRDGDARAAYVLYDSATRVVQYHRLLYDIDTAMNKIRNAGLPDLLAKRLALGR